MLTVGLDKAPKGNNQKQMQAFCEEIELRRQKSEEQPLELREFQIGLKIGQGAFAQVRRAVHQKTKAVIALKTYDKKNLKQEEAA